jgi:LysR family transcriptional regulator, cell division regulator
MISPQEITYFLECSRTGNLSRAAERLGVTQPALTLALKRLEHSAGAELFHRSKKGVRLTKAGELFQQEATALAGQWSRITSSLRRSEEELAGTYTIGCHPSVALYSLPQSLPKILADFPALRVDIHHDLSRKVTEAVIRGGLDLGIVVNPVRHPDLVIRPLCRDQVGFWRSRADSPNNKVDGNRTVLLCQPELLQTQALLRRLKMGFSRQVHSTSLEVIAALAEGGAGIAILPGRVASQWKQLRPLISPLSTTKSPSYTGRRAASPQRSGSWRSRSRKVSAEHGGTGRSRHCSAQSAVQGA